LALLRLALACGEKGLVSRYVAETVLRHVWRGGADAGDAARVVALKQTLQPKRDPASDAVKGELKSNADEAIARGLFGVPTLAVDDKLFWGFDSLPMLRAYLEGDAWFDGDEWNAVTRLPAAAGRVNKPAS
jgi:2-hydroxychromene-2-carboxylate isomerase